MANDSPPRVARIWSGHGCLGSSHRTSSDGDYLCHLAEAPDSRGLQSCFVLLGSPLAPAAFWVVGVRIASDEPNLGLLGPNDDCRNGLARGSYDLYDPHGGVQPVGSAAFLPNGDSLSGLQPSQRNCVGKGATHASVQRLDAISTVCFAPSLRFAFCRCTRHPHCMDGRHLCIAGHARAANSSRGCPSQFSGTYTVRSSS